MATGPFSRGNEATAGLCAGLVRQAVAAGLESVAVITPDVEQASRVRQLLARDRHVAGRVECSTVHRFQGHERDLVVLDTVDTEPLAPGVLLAGQGPGADAARLLNVSVSRARGKPVILADVDYCRRRAPASAMAALLDRALQLGVGVRARDLG
jgi:superfamily I DNA and/or RNA helicase